MELSVETPPKRDQAEASQTKGILIVERDSCNAMFLTEFLVSKGYEVMVATHEAEGLHILQTYSINGIFLNMDDTVLDGREMVRMIRTHYSHIPLFLMGAELKRKTLMEAFNGGVKGFISIPLLYDQLYEVLFIFEGRCNGLRMQY